MAASVEVMCPNAHRVTVKTTPNMKLLEVLDEACKKKGFLPSEDYDLKHGRKVVNLSDTIRFSGLPNHAKLEMVKAEKSRSLENPVTVGLQLDDGSRILHTCNPPTTLWDLLLQCAELPNGPSKERLLSRDDGQHPVIVYMREEVVGEFALKHTTLKKLGLLGGRAALRLIYRSIDEATLQTVQDKIEADQQKHARLEAKAQVAAAQERVEADRVKQAQLQAKSAAQSAALQAKSSETAAPTSPASQSVVGTQSETAMSVDSGSSLSAQAAAASSRVEEPMEVVEPNSNTPQPEPSVPSTSKSDQQKEKKLKKLLPGMYMGGQVTNQGQLSAAYERNQPAFQAPVRAVILPLADFKFPEATKGQNLYKNELNDFKKEDFMPCAREEVLFNLNAVQSDNTANSEDVPDDFFQVTVSDVQRMYSELQKQVALADEQPLMTRELRLAQEEAKLGRYPHAIIRFHFPDRHVLQAVFRPRESVNALYKFVKIYLEDKEIPFYLYTTPPRKVLKDKAQLLHQADLIPLSVVYFGSEVQKSCYLSSAVLGEVSTNEKAEEIVCKHFNKENGGEGMASQQTSSKRAVNDSSSRPSTSKAASASGSGATQKVPKWFKTGKK